MSAPGIKSIAASSTGAVLRMTSSVHIHHAASPADKFRPDLDAPQGICDEGYSFAGSLGN
jgi:hypothetical protein